MHRERVGPVRWTAAAALLTTLGILPVFLVGALAPFMQRDLHFGPAELGWIVASFFAASAGASLVIGRTVERVGPWTAGAVAGVAEAAVLVTVSFVPLTWELLAAVLAIAGVANAIGQLAANLLIATHVPTSRRGLAFGVKQSAVPAASLIGGLCIPLLALTIGWTWSFGLSALLFAAWLVLAPRSAVVRPAQGQRRSVRMVVQRHLVFLALAAAAGAGAANAMAAFFVSSAVATSIDPALAGALLALGAACGISSRVVLGWRADRMRGNPLRLVAALMATGAVGLLLIGTQGFALMTGGIVLGYAAGWGWNGLLTHVVAGDNPDAPAVATGITQAGIYVGGIFGPIAFGTVAEAVSYPAAWTMAATLLLGAAGLTYAASLRARAPLGLIPSVGTPNSEGS